MTLGLRYQPRREQRELTGALEDAIVAILPVARLRRAWHESDDAWLALEQLGLFDLTVDEALGGSGLGATEEVLIAMMLGRQLAAPAVFATLGAAHIRHDSGRPIRVAAAFGNDRPFLIEQPGSAAVLVRRPDAADLGAIIAGVPIDPNLWAAALARIEAPAEPVVSADVSCLIRLRLLDAAALAGIAAAALDKAVDHAKFREQFGRAIGSFQAVKHHCANMAIAARSAHDLTTFAAVAIDEGRRDAAMYVDCAFLIAASAAIDNAAINVQIHGGIGFSDEAEPHFYLKRARLLTAIGGGLEAANERISMLRTAKR